ncbi:MAG: cytochrome c protein [Thermoleophilia bacterium]|nr:cytochrome c protein [Thermoleophilia bacterium]
MRATFHPLLLLLTVLALAGCDAPGGSALKETDEPVDRDRGRQLFQQTCRACHSLADARAAGVFGPDLDLLQPDAERVREQITSGGGGMPPDLLDGEDADTVARYVGEVAGAKPEVEGEGGTRGNAKPSGDDA